MFLGLIMKKHKNSLLSVMVIAAVLTLPGCGAMESISSIFTTDSSLSEKPGTIHVVDTTPDSIAHYVLGRDYAAAGRYELAREQYLLALAASNNQEMQQTLTMELDSINLMIKSLR
jgi:hypothetical protein